MAVYHGGDAVETETVETVLLHPVFDIGEQKMLDLCLAVVEVLGVPVGLASGLSGGAVVVVGSVQFVEPLVEVLYIVRMHEVHYDGYPLLMGLADQRLELFGSAETRRRGEEIGDMIAEAAVVGVFGYCHELNGVVAQLFHARYYVACELAVKPHPLLFLGHAYVTLVYQRRAYGCRIEVVAFPVERLRSPHLSGEVVRFRLFHRTHSVGGQTFVPSVVAVDRNFV